MKCKLIQIVIMICGISVYFCHGKQQHQQQMLHQPNHNRINRVRGNILQNLTRTHEYDDNIVTSRLDASVQIRQFYRAVRDIYNR